MIVSIHSIPVKSWTLRQLGRVLLLGRTPVHCQLYWKKDQTFVTELSSIPVGKILAEGNGYYIVSRPADKCEGKMYEGRDVDIEMIAKMYPSSTYGYHTCNTYVSWLAERVCKESPERPAGAIGW